MPETPRDGQWRPGLAVLGPALTTLAVLVVASELIPARPDAGPGPGPGPEAACHVRPGTGSVR